jgi:SAM-dependent methyltransferase
MDLRELGEQRPVNRYPWEIERARAIRQVLSQSLSLSGLSSILDVGCGDGYLAFQLLRNSNADRVDCVDVNMQSDQMDTFSRLHPGIAFHNTFDSLSNNSYQLILLLDVLEHVENELEFLRSIVAFARPEAHVLVTAPAFQSLFSAHDRFLNHNRRYSRKELLSVIRQAGLHCRRSGYLFTSLLFPRLLSLLLERFLPQRPPAAQGIGSWNHGPLVTKTITLALTADNLVSLGLSRINLILPGLSAWTLCRVRQSQ